MAKWQKDFLPITLSILWHQSYSDTKSSQENKYDTKILKILANWIQQLTIRIFPMIWLDLFLRCQDGSTNANHYDT